MCLIENCDCFVDLCEKLGMIPPWVTTHFWICDVLCILLNDTILIPDDKATVFLFNKVQNMYDSATPLPHELLLIFSSPIQEHQKHSHRIRFMCVPYVFFILIC